MGKVTIEKRQFENDKGALINYNVICVRGSLNGQEQKIEKAVSNTEAMLIGMLLDSDEDLSVATGGKGEDVQVNRVKG